MPAHCENAEKMFPVKKTVMLPNDAFKGKVAFITGGGTGLGKAMATTFAMLGARVAIAARRLDVLTATAGEITRLSGQKVLPIAMDVRDPAAVKSAADAVVKEFGTLPHIVVNNAAGNFIQATERLSPNAFRNVVDIVLNGTFYVTLEFGRRLVAAEQGCSFLAITTPYAHTGSPFVVPSACAKAGVETMTKSLAAEWGRHGMRFNAIAPGPIYTEVSTARMKTCRTQGAFTRLDPTGQFSANAHTKLPVGRLGDPAELANLAAYMVSDYSSWMNGAVGQMFSHFKNTVQIIDYDGGETRLNGGEFSGLHAVTTEQWGMLEQMIRQKTAKAKL